MARPLTEVWRRRAAGLNNKGGTTSLQCPSCDDGRLVKVRVDGVRRLVCDECAYQQDVVSGAFKGPVDAWRSVKKGSQPYPPLFEGSYPLWMKVAQRVNHDVKKGVVQQFPVIGGRRRYHHRPLTSWKLSNGKVLTITSDPLEAKAWNRLKRKRHEAFPSVSDTFSISPPVGVRVWAIVHEALTFPPPEDWDHFVDSFFRWRAMQHGGLAPAKQTDLKEFLEYVIDPEKSDPKTLKKDKVEFVLPWQMTKQRRKDTDDRRTSLIRDPGLEKKIQWAKSALRFLSQNKVKFRDFDPSNLGVTKRGGRTVITNIAESRSIPKRTGRMGRVKASSGIQEVVTAFNLLLEGGPAMGGMYFMSGETRYLVTILNDHPAARALLLFAAKMGTRPDAEATERGMAYLNKLAVMTGGKATKLYLAINKVV